MKPPETHNPYYTHFPNESFQWYIYGLVIIRSVLALFELVILMSGISFPFQDGDRGAKCLFWMFPPLTVAFNLVTLFGSFTVKMCNMPVYVSQWYDDDVSPYHQKETLNLETLSGLLEIEAHAKKGETGESGFFFALVGLGWCMLVEGYFILKIWCKGGGKAHPVETQKKFTIMFYMWFGITFTSFAIFVSGNSEGFDIPWECLFPTTASVNAFMNGSFNLLNGYFVISERPLWSLNKFLRDHTI
mmetsp:Transcript_10305/g.18636  ORF Transcript_10305/g.18636 Transcript_10305/m.18636 type:complete len:245 (+) Transcript_10305:494-1228(+)